jgi:hypothetical protein
MSDHILTLAKAKLFVENPGLYRLFWKDWNVITVVEHDAIEYLVKFSCAVCRTLCSSFSISCTWELLRILE